MGNYKNILEEADLIVNQRADTDRKYPDPITAHQEIAKRFNDITGSSITAGEVCLLMILLKLGRQAHHHKTDNLVDICGYAQIWQMCEEAEPIEREENED